MVTESAALLWFSGLRSWCSPGLMNTALLLILTGWLLIALIRDLPLQNVIAVSGIVFLFAVLADFATARWVSTSGDPGLFRGRDWNEIIIFFGTLLSGRGVAEGLLTRKRLSHWYGAWLVILNAVLAAGPATMSVTWDREYSVRQLFHPLLSILLCHLIIAGITLVCATPWLVKRKPANAPGPWKLWITWFAINAWVMANCVYRGHWGFTVLLVAGNGILFVALPILSRDLQAKSVE